MFMCVRVVILCLWLVLGTFKLGCELCFMCLLLTLIIYMFGFRFVASSVCVLSVLIWLRWWLCLWLILDCFKLACALCFVSLLPILLVSMVVLVMLRVLLCVLCC